MFKGSTWVVDGGFTFRTAGFRLEKAPNFCRSAIARNASSPAVVIRIRSCFNMTFFFNVCLTDLRGLGPS